MDIGQLVIKIVGNLFIIVLVVRAFSAYAKKAWGELITEIVVAIVLICFIYLTDQTIAILKWIAGGVIGWFNH